MFFDEDLLIFFSIGDMVSWKDWGIEEERCGIIYDIRVDLPFPDKSRGYVVADIETIDGRWETRGLGQLMLDSKVKKNEIHNSKKKSH